MVADKERQVAVVERLLALGADVAPRSHDDGRTALQEACWAGKPRTVTLLLDAGASINARDKLGFTPLIWAAIRGRSGCVRLLLARGGDALEVDAQTEGDGMTALHAAVGCMRDKIAQLLLDAGADPTVRDDTGKTPLHRPGRQLWNGRSMKRSGKH